MRLEGLGHLKNPMTSSGIEATTFRLAAYCLKQLTHRVTENRIKKILIIKADGSAIYSEYISSLIANKLERFEYKSAK
jgi:hypothetical protein